MTLEMNDLARLSNAADGSYVKMSEDGVPRERYYAQSFGDLEREKLWTKTWQAACRLEEIPKVGDYSEYVIADQSFLVVRVTEDEVKAYSNHCRHRGNELGNGNGSYRAGKIVCSFHGWRWNLDGSNDKVLAPEGFLPACLDPERLRLREAKVAISMGFVWINPDPDAPEFGDHMAESLPYWAPLKMEDMRMRWWKYMNINANWKTVMEPFLESYHIAQTHPEIAGHVQLDDWQHENIATGYVYAADGGGWGANPPATDGVPPGPMPGISMIDNMIVTNEAMHDGIDAALMRDWQIEIQNELYHKQGLRDLEYLAAFNERLYAQAEERGMDMVALADGGGFAFGFLFPNIVITAMYGNAFIQRVRPDGTDPEKSITEWYVVGLPEADFKAKRPKRVGPLEYEDWGFVAQQDLSNIEKLQRGVKSAGFTEAKFSEPYEGLILHFHRALEKYLDR